MIMDPDREEGTSRAAVTAIADADIGQPVAARYATHTIMVSALMISPTRNVLSMYPAAIPAVCTPRRSRWGSWG